MNARILTYLFAIISASTLACWPGTYSLSFSSCDGGAGLCAGGKFRLSGVAGQPDGGACTAGAYTLQGGFMHAFQKPVGPVLTTVPYGNTLFITWPNNSCHGFHLEATANLSDGPWSDLGEGLVYGSDRLVAVSMSSNYTFFRLRKSCAGGCPQTCSQ